MRKTYRFDFILFFTISHIISTNIPTLADYHKINDITIYIAGWMKLFLICFRIGSVGHKRFVGSIRDTVTLRETHFWNPKSSGIESSLLL